MPDSQPRRSPVPFVLATVAIDALGFGIIIPVVPPLVMALSGRGADYASLWMGMQLATFSAMQVLCSPLLGALSDRYGRRPVLLLSLAGVTASYLMLAWAPSLVWLLVGRLVAGATAANYAAATAALADLTPPAQRAQRFGLVGAMFGLGFVVGPAMGGLLAGFGLRVPFLAAGALAAANLLYGAWAVPETLRPENRRPFRARAANPFVHLPVLLRDGTFARMAAAWCAAWFALGALQSCFVLANGVRLGWGTQQNGLALAAIGLGIALVQGLLVRRIIGRLGERRAALLGYTLSLTGYAAFALAVQPWILFVGIALLSAGAISGPAVQALFSSRAGPERQGEVQGALASFQGLTAIVAPPLAGWVFGATAPAVPFVLAALAYAVAFVALRGVRKAPA